MVFRCFSDLFFGEAIMLDVDFSQQCSITKVVSHHDAWVEGSEIESGYRLLVVAWLWVEDIGAFKPYLIVVAFNSFSGHDKVPFSCFSEKLTHNFDLLASPEQKVYWDPGDSGHLTIVVKTCQFFHQFQWQLGIL